MKLVHKETAFEDERGRILDILENGVIDSVTIISSKKGAVRGNHYHKESVQYTFVLKGEMMLFTQMPGEETEVTVLGPGDLAFTPPLERHALVARKDSEFLALTRGPRRGQNYEQDTYRLEKSLVSD